MDPVTLIYELLGSAAIVAGGVTWIVRRLDERSDRQDARLSAIEAKQGVMQSQLDVQFGGNGNGMRQAIDQHGKDIAFIKGSLGISQD